MKAIPISLIILLGLIFYMPSVLARPNPKGIGANFSYSVMPAGWLPPLDYDFYMIQDIRAPTEVFKYLDKSHKRVGVKIYQETHPFPDKGYIDSLLDRVGKYLDFVTISEEVRTGQIPELNDTYDYIKEHYPYLKVYQVPHTNYFDFNRLGELKADGFIISPRWWYVGKGFEEKFLFPALATGKPVINALFIGLYADAPELGPLASWEYAIGQYRVCKEYKVPVLIVEAFYPGYENLVKERLEIITK